MTKADAQKLLRIIMDTYPTYKPADPALAINIWQELLAEYDYKVVGEALKRFMKTDTSGFAPTPGQIIDKIVNMAPATSNITSSEAWSLVYKAICNGTYNSLEEFNKLPKAVQRAVGSPEQIKAWAMDDSFNAGVESSNFKRAYDTVMKREVEEAKIAPDLKVLENIRNQLFLEGNKHGNN